MVDVQVLFRDIELSGFYEEGVKTTHGESHSMIFHPFEKFLKCQLRYANSSSDEEKSKETSPYAALFSVSQPLNPFCLVTL